MWKRARAEPVRHRQTKGALPICSTYSHRVTSRRYARWAFAREYAKSQVHVKPRQSPPWFIHSPAMNQAFASYDVVVIGGGHAGCEAAAASARFGARTLLLTHKRETIGEMSCNPAIGGLGKGHLVREIDALDGLMGRARSRPASSSACSIAARARPCAGRAPRPTASSIARRCRRCWPRQPNLEIVEGAAEDLVLERSAGSPGVVLGDGRRSSRPAVVLTTGTFLRRPDPYRREQDPGGPGRRSAGDRPGRRPCTALASRWAGSRPARRRGSTAQTIDWAGLEVQPGDDPPAPFSFLTERDHDAADRLPHHRHDAGDPCASSAPICTARRCIRARSRAPGRAIARRSRTRSCASPTATGTRSSWSRKGWTTTRSIPTASPPRCREDVQEALLRDHSRAGAGARCIRPGYAIEYDYRRSARADADAGDQAGAGPLSGRPDQRHHRL